MTASDTGPGEPRDLAARVRALADEWQATYDRWAGVSDAPRVGIFRAHAQRLRALLPEPASSDDTEPVRTALASLDGTVEAHNAAWQRASDDAEPALQTQPCASPGCQQAGYVDSEQWDAYLCGSHAVTGPEPAQQDDWERRLHDKFRVERTYPSRRGIDHRGCRYFVLDPQHDLVARQALGFYAQHADRFGYRELAADLRAWLDGIDPAETPFPGAPAQPAVEPGDVEALARLIWGCGIEDLIVGKGEARDAIHRLLASDWKRDNDAEVAARARAEVEARWMKVAVMRDGEAIREAQADAYDEGVGAGQAWGRRVNATYPRNPYREGTR